MGLKPIVWTENSRQALNCVSHYVGTTRPNLSPHRRVVGSYLSTYESIQDMPRTRDNALGESACVRTYVIQC